MGHKHHHHAHVLRSRAKRRHDQHKRTHSRKVAVHRKVVAEHITKKHEIEKVKKERSDNTYLSYGKEVKSGKVDLNTIKTNDTVTMIDGKAEFFTPGEGCLIAKVSDPRLSGPFGRNVLRTLDKLGANYHFVKEHNTICVVTGSFFGTTKLAEKLCDKIEGTNVYVHIGKASNGVAGKYGSLKADLETVEAKVGTVHGDRDLKKSPAPDYITVTIPSYTSNGDGNTSREFPSAVNLPSCVVMAITYLWSRGRMKHGFFMMETAPPVVGSDSCCGISHLNLFNRRKKSSRRKKASTYINQTPSAPEDVELLHSVGEFAVSGLQVAENISHLDHHHH